MCGNSGRRHDGIGEGTIGGQDMKKPKKVKAPSVARARGGKALRKR